MKSPEIQQFSNNLRQFPPQTDLRQIFGGGDKFYFLERGRIRIIELCGDGNEILLEELGAGDFFGENSFFLKPFQSRNTITRTVDNCTVVEFSRSEFFVHLENDAELLEYFLFILGKRMAHTERRIAILGVRGIAKRLGNMLLFLAQTSGIRTGKDNENEFKIFVTHEELADLTFISRQRVTQLMNSFRDMGLLTYKRNKPLIINTSALAEYLDGRDFNA